MGSQILIKVLGFFYRIIQTNIPQFSDVGNSYYGSGYQVYTFILAIATMGIPNTISKLVSEKITVGDRRGAHKIFKTAFLVFVSIATIFALGLFFGAGIISDKILNNPGVKYTLMALSPAIIFVSMSAVLRGYFIGMENVSEYSKAQIIEQVINCVFSVIFVFMLIGNSPEIMAAGSTLATTVATSAAFFYLVRYYKKNRAEIWREINKAQQFATESRKKIAKKLISYAIPISFGSVVSALSGLIDVVTVVNGLQKYGYDIVTANAKYGILSGKVDILLAVPLSINVAFSVALVPFISSAIARHRKDEALDSYFHAYKIRKMISKKNPNVHDAEMSDSSMKIASVYLDKKDPDSAYPYIKETISLRERLYKISNDTYFKWYAQAIFELGRYYEEKNNIEEAKQNYLESLHLQTSKDIDIPTNAEALHLIFKKLKEIYKEEFLKVLSPKEKEVHDDLYSYNDKHPDNKIVFDPLYQD